MLEKQPERVDKQHGDTVDYHPALAPGTQSISGSAAGRTDTVTATSKEDPAYKTAAIISCGDQTLVDDGLAARYGPF